jgi:hypothetical protein
VLTKHGLALEHKKTEKKLIFKSLINIWRKCNNASSLVGNVSDPDPHGHAFNLPPESGTFGKIWREKN